MRIFVIVAVLCTGLVSVWNASPAESVETVRYRTLLSRNLVNLNKLRVGMTREQVFKTMGTFQSRTRDSVIPNPYKTERFIVGKTQYEALYYLTDKYPPFTRIKLSQATPVVLKEGLVIGWGWEALRRAKAGRYESTLPRRERPIRDEPPKRSARQDTGRLPIGGLASLGPLQPGGR